MPDSHMTQPGVVIIGRNEGERLRRCVRSVLGHAGPVVYVDSGSSDGSVGWVLGQGIDAVELDLSVPFSAARARNTGFEHLLSRNPGIELVQFIDGDCEMMHGWWGRAVAEFGGRPDIAVVCGRLRERFPERSIYNRLCDMEWQRPIGLIDACGGIFMVRADGFARVGGFNPAIVAGEEPELCLRLRRAGMSVLSIDADMAWHDADMHRFGQWWKRMVRSGHAYAEGFWRHGRGAERYEARPLLSILLWALAIPLVAIGAAWPTYGLSLLLLLLYPIQAYRIYRRESKRRSTEGLRLYPAFMLLGKFAQLAGVAKFFTDRLLGRRSRVIEYKHAPADAADPAPRATQGSR